MSVISARLEITYIIIEYQFDKSVVFTSFYSHTMQQLIIKWDIAIVYLILIFLKRLLTGDDLFRISLFFNGKL